MAKKTTTSFNLDKAISRIAKPSVFDRIVKEIDAKMLYPIHTVHPDLYKKVAKYMTIVEEGKKYELRR